MNEPDDSELARRAGAGDAEAFGELIRRHHARVAGLCARLLDNPSDADDAAQEIFLRAHRFLGKFRGEARFSTWLYRIALNHCRDRRRAGARRRSVSLDALFEERGDATPELREKTLSGAAQEDAAAAQAMLERLPEGPREALLLRTQGSSYAEIAQTLDCSLDAVKARLRRARRALADDFRRQTSPASVQADSDGATS